MAQDVQFERQKPKRSPTEVIMVRNNSGFTIQELMVVIGIIALLSAIAMPNLIGWLPKHRLGSGAREILSAIENTRLTAVRHNADAAITFDAGASSFSASVNGSVFKSGSMPAGIVIDSVTFSGSTLTFNGQGIPTSGGGRVNLMYSDNTSGQPDKVIEVRVGGNAKIL
jgi:type IV fimbrial biogenesis protein FimT